MWVSLKTSFTKVWHKCHDSGVLCSRRMKHFDGAAYQEDTPTTGKLCRACMQLMLVSSLAKNGIPAKRTRTLVPVAVYANQNWDRLRSNPGKCSA